VLIDDGGHTNRQQIVTCRHAIENINDGGILIVEDVHTSYFREFGNPSRYSFLSFAIKLVDVVNSRAHALRQENVDYSSRIYSVSFYESIVAFQIDSQLCKKTAPTSNNGVSRGVTDFRYHGRVTATLFAFKNKFGNGASITARVVKRGVDTLLSLLAKLEAVQYRKYFKDGF